MSNLLADKTAVVTGAASGNGRAIARRFAEHGADVVVADVREEPREGGRPTHELVVDETDREAAYVECDVTDREDVEAAVDAAAATGGVDVMVNNAGIVGPQDGLFELDWEEYERLMAINLRGVFYGCQAAARRMVENGGGSIVNMSSVAGIEGYGGITPYSAAKGGIRLLTYGLASELGSEGVRVNAIHPGVIETTMTTEDEPIVGTEQGEMIKQTLPLGRFGQPEDVADTALFLASDLSSYVTAESILVDGGMLNSA